MKLAVILLLAFIVGVGGYLVYQGQLPASLDAAKPLQFSSEAKCFLQDRPCTASTEQAQITLTLTPRPVPLMQPVQASIKISGLNDLNAIELKIEGMNMYMGFQNVQLVKQSNTDWQGNFSLPICSEAEMQWLVTVALSSPQQNYQARFNLVTQH